jgi:hypothetical protein
MIKTSSQIADEVLAKLAENFLRNAVKGAKKTQRAVQAPAKVRELKSVIQAPKPKPPAQAQMKPPKPPAPQKKTPKPVTPPPTEGVPKSQETVKPVKAPEPTLTSAGKAPDSPKAPQLASRAQVPPGYSKTTGPTEQQQPGAGYFNTRPGK